ncbi:ABC transporter substrate-binding protein [Streptomyces sp. NPDC002644]
MKPLRPSRMTRTSRPTRVAVAATAVLAATGLSACGAADTGATASSGGAGDKVTIAVPSWVGAEANAAVAAHILEQEYDVRVEKTQIDESVAFDGLDSGKIDAILEDWGGAPDKIEKYVDERKSVVSAGYLGVTGKIGWFVPEYLAEKHPDITDWKNLDKYADLFRTAESGDKGQLLEGSPSYTTNDDALVKNLDLDFKTVYAGSEAAQITQIQQSYKVRKPFLTYWWTPNWVNEDVKMVEVKLPGWTEGCDDDPKAVDCGYPETPLQKYLNADFAKDGGKPAEFLKRMQWTEEDQNEVAAMIAGERMSPEDAAEKWVAENEDVWKAWLA